jgi:hypothetical protein
MRCGDDDDQEAQEHDRRRGNEPRLEAGKRLAFEPDHCGGEGESGEQGSQGEERLDTSHARVSWLTWMGLPTMVRADKEPSHRALMH